MSQLTISTQEKRFPVAPDLYGLFFEDISHAGDGGLYPEMLRNRSFEDSLLPDGCITNDNGTCSLIKIIHSMIIGAFLFKLILRKMAKSITSDIMALIKKKEIHIISICLQNQNKHCI